MMPSPDKRPSNKFRASSLIFSTALVIALLLYLVLTMGHQPSFAQNDATDTKTPTPTFTRTVTVTPSGTLFGPLRPTPNATQQDQTLDAIAQSRLRASAIARVTRTEGAVVQATINAKINAYLTATAENGGPTTQATLTGPDRTLDALLNRRLTQTAQPPLSTAYSQTVDAHFNQILTATALVASSSTPTPSLNPTEIQQTLSAAVATRVVQQFQAQIGLTSTAIIQSTANIQVNDLFTATSQAHRAELISGLNPITVDNAAQITELGQLKGHTGKVTGITFSQDGAFLASAGEDNTVRLWDIQSGNQIALNQGVNKRLTIAINQDGTRLASSSTDGTVRTFDARTGDALLVLKPTRGNFVVTALAFNGDGSQIAAGSSDGQIRIWDASRSTTTVVVTIRAHSSAVTSLAFSPDGSILMSGGSDGQIRTWEARTGAALSRFSDSQITGVAFSPDGSLIVSGNATGQVKIRDAQSGDVKETIKGTGALTEVSWSADGKIIAASSADGTIQLWDASDGNPLVTLKGHTGPVTGISFSSDSARLASSGVDGTIRLWGILKR